MSYDVILAGAGLANSLIALALCEAHPKARVLMLDQADGPSGGHTWAFHHPDLSAPWHQRLALALRASWPDQEVKFPSHSRLLRAGYGALDGQGLARALAQLPNLTVQWQAQITQISAQGVLLGDHAITAPCVIDGRGALPSAHLVTGFQKFVGVEIETDRPHGLTRPILMDATLPQEDGYRFVYVLPFLPDRLLIEDTRYSDGADLDEAALLRGLDDYATAKGWQGHEVRRERGVLPITLAHDAKAFWHEAAGGAVPVGMRAGLFHPVTGYSLPVAAQVADLIAASPLQTEAVFQTLRRFALARARQDRFLRLLNRMLFRGCAPARRHHVLSRFYRLPEPLIERFYAGKLTRLDRLRIVIGKPPIPLQDALGCLREAPLLKEAP